jgi:UDP-N-acetylglucosamine 2-epimerase
MKLLTVIGARPQFIKAAVVSRAIAAHNERASGGRRIDEILVHTGQHYDDNMSAVFFQELAIPEPSHRLGVGSGPHGQQTGRMLEGLERVMQDERPSLVMVYGDTNSTLAGALAASKLGLPVAHVEAGLRSFNRAMPEEINRVVADHLSGLLLCPTARAVKNLSCEGITAGVHLVGDVMYDSLLFNLRQAEQSTGILAKLALQPGEYALATVHRAENTDQPATLRNLVAALSGLGIPVVLPLHPRTKAALLEAGVTQLPDRILAVPPVSYQEMLLLERHASVILTDSGGIQKEAFLLGVPCVTLRNETEWVETVDAGWNRVAGTAPEAVIAAARTFLEDRPAASAKPYGDGHAAEAIVGIMSEYRRESRP